MPRKAGRLSVDSAMRGRLLRTWLDIRDSFWFVPGLLCAAAILLAELATWVDRRQWLPEAQSGWMSWMSKTGPEGARAVLAAIAGSMMTVAGTVFSITIVSLSLASQQLGPRLLRTFMRDRGNQVVLGAFTATFLYSLLVLRTVSGTGSTQFVPHWSVSVAVLLAILSVGVLIYFIHHISVSIQAPSVLASVARELNEQIDLLRPERHPHNGLTSAVSREWPSADQAGRICFAGGGYVQTIDVHLLVKLACEHDLQLLIESRPGQFVTEFNACVLVWPAEKLDEALEETIRSAFTLGPMPTPQQDPEYALNQLVEVAVRALSTGINDPFTAMTGIDHMSAALARMAKNPEPPSVYLDQSERPRVKTRPANFCLLLQRGYEPIRMAAANTPLVLLRMLETLAVIAPRLHRDEDAAALKQEADWLAHHAQKLPPDDPLRLRIEAQHRRVQHALIARR